MIIRLNAKTVGAIIACLVAMWIAYNAGKHNAPDKIIFVRVDDSPDAESRQTLKVATCQAELGSASLELSNLDCSAFKSGTHCQGTLRNLAGREYHGLKLKVTFLSPKGRKAHFVYDLDIISPSQTFELDKSLTDEETKEFGLQFADVMFKNPAVPSTLEESEFKDANIEATASVLSPKQ